jgi:flagellar hook-associated protein 2
VGNRIPGGGSGLIPPNMVEDLIKAQGLPVETAKKRRELIAEERTEFTKVQTLLTELDSTLSGLKTKSDFYRMKAESSHPDILDGEVTGVALPGTYEFEVRGLARADKKLAYGLPDKDQSKVGFGYMLIEREDKSPFEITINPGSTLNGVAQQINDADAGVRAMVVNTKYKPDAYRLLIISEQSGKESRFIVDEDTTFMEFKEQVIGRNLDVLFEDVPVTDEDNVLEELVDGLIFTAKRAEPGTVINVNIGFDVDATMEGIKGFVDKYNEIAKFVHEQFQLNEDKRAGTLASDSTIKQVMRSLQNQFAVSVRGGGRYSTLAEVGITTNPKSGELNLDENKLRQSLTENYEGVAELFIQTANAQGIAHRLATQIKNMRDPGFGAVRSKLRTYDRIIENADQDIERREMLLQQREESIRRRFSALEGRLAGMQSQGNFLAQRMAQGGG